MSDLTSGEVEITLAEGTATLSPTLYAATRVSKAFGGFQNALNRVAAGDLEALATVVRYGLGLKSDAEARNIEQTVYEAGVLRLTAPVTEYLLVLSNGGRPLSDLAPADGDAAAEKKDAG